MILDNSAGISKIPHVSYNSGYYEWYTPSEYIEAARRVLGVIDLDPASSEVANSVVCATKFYDLESDGLSQEWIGKVWMNPPFSSRLIGMFIDKLLSSHLVTDAVVFVNNATETRWFQSLAKESSAICFPSGRVRCWGPAKSKSSPLQGQAILYLGDDYERFLREFSKFGTVWKGNSE